MFKSITGFSRYAVDEEGVVYSYFTNKALCGRPDAKGYLSVVLVRDDGKHVTRRIHRLVAETHIPNPSNLPCVRHRDGSTTNNKKLNLLWGTYQENEQDKISHGTYDLRRNGKLSVSDRCKILTLYATGVPQKTLAVQFGVSRPTINRLLNSKTWSNLKCAA